MAVTSKQGAAFVAALTADDLITAADQCEARQINLSAKLLANDYVEAAYHAAGTAKAAATIAWRKGNGGRWQPGQEAHWNALQADHDRACRALIVAAERYVAIPCVNKSEASYRLKQLAAWSKACGGSQVLAMWRTADQRWTAHLNAEAERLTKKREARS